MQWYSKDFFIWMCFLMKTFLFRMLLQKLRYMKQDKKSSLLREEALFLPVGTIVCPFAHNNSAPRLLLGAAWAYRVFVSVYVEKGEFVY